jgi:hypothetical protein
MIVVWNDVLDLRVALDLCCFGFVSRCFCRCLWILDFHVGLESLLSLEVQRLDITIF